VFCVDGMVESCQEAFLEQILFKKLYLGTYGFAYFFLCVPWFFLADFVEC